MYTKEQSQITITTNCTRFTEPRYKLMLIIVKNRTFEL